jgi:2-keto-4-pentenoate hydratase
VLCLLTWLANHTNVRSGGLRRGDIVTTGSWTGLRFVASGARVEAAFPGIGGVDAEF